MPVVISSGGVATLELETIVDPEPAALPPRIRVSVVGDATERTYGLTRLCAGESWALPGWKARTFSDAVVDTDWAAPTGRPITYTLHADGVLVCTAIIQLDYPHGVLQDPVDPTRWVNVSSKSGTGTGAFMRDMGEISRPTEASLIPVLGSRYPVAVGGQVMAGSVGLSFSTRTPEAEAAFRSVVDSAPVPLLRPTVDMTPLPALAYLSGGFAEQPVTVHYGGGLTRWSASPNLVTAVMVAAVSGYVTYDEVQQLLAGVTYDEVQAAMAGHTYLDWQKNPLIYATL